MHLKLFSRITLWQETKKGLLLLLLLLLMMIIQVKFPVEYYIFFIIKQVNQNQDIVKDKQTFSRHLTDPQIVEKHF